MSDLTLSPAQIEEITGYRRGAEQLRELAKMGIPARRSRGRVRVIRAHVEAFPKQAQEPMVRRVR